MATGLVKCPECGRKQVPGLWKDTRWAFRTFALGISAPNYLMGGVTLAAMWFGDIGMGTCLSGFLLAVTFGLAIGMCRDVTPRRVAWWRAAVLALAWWAGLNAPVIVLTWWGWPW